MEFSYILSSVMGRISLTVTFDSYGSFCLEVGWITKPYFKVSDPHQRVYFLDK